MIRPVGVGRFIGGVGPYRGYLVSFDLTQIAETLRTLITQCLTIFVDKAVSVEWGGKLGNAATTELFKF